MIKEMIATYYKDVSFWRFFWYLHWFSVNFLIELSKRQVTTQPEHIWQKGYDQDLSRADLWRNSIAIREICQKMCCTSCSKDENHRHLRKYMASIGVYTAIYYSYIIDILSSPEKDAVCNALFRFSLHYLRIIGKYAGWLLWTLGTLIHEPDTSANFWSWRAQWSLHDVYVCHGSSSLEPQMITWHVERLDLLVPSSTLKLIMWTIWVINFNHWYFYIIYHMNHHEGLMWQTSRMAGNKKRRSLRIAPPLRCPQK